MCAHASEVNHGQHSQGNPYRRAGEPIWDALQDVGALHTRLVPGFVKDTKMEGNARHRHFRQRHDGQEEIISIDSTRQRVAWAVIGQRFAITTAQPGWSRIRRAARDSSGPQICCPMSSRGRWIR